MSTTPAPAAPATTVATPARPTTLRAILRLAPYLKPVRTRLVLGAVSALVGSVVALLIPQVLRQVVDGPLASGDPGAVLPLALLVLALGVAEAAAIAARRWFVLVPGTNVEAQMRNDFAAHLQDLPVAFHDRWPSGQLLSRMISDLNLIRRWLSFGAILLVVNLLTIVIGLAFLFSISWVLGVLFVLCSIPIWVMGFAFERRYSVIARRSQDQAGDLATSVEESVHGIRVLKAFGRGGHALKQFAEQAEQLRGTELEKARAIAAIWMWLLLVPDVTFAVSLGAGVALAANGLLTVGGLAAFFATATVLRFPVESIGFLMSMTFDTRNAIDRFYEVMDERNTVRDPEQAVRIPDPSGRLVFEDVHFSYPDAAPGTADLLAGVDLVVEPGETMALVGVTGSGKSTLTELVGRLYDVTGGRILIDGVDIRDLTRQELRRHIAMAFEEATLFSASVRENVLMGRPGASEADLAEALDIAQAGFVRDLPAGLETTIGEEGLSLSGGQRQRLALARAVAAKPDILVLDDPLSALDVDTEALVEAALRRVLGTTTALIVAHRPSTVQLADRVAVLEDGRITAVGTHAELLATSEHYRYVISSFETDEHTMTEEVHA